MWCLPIPVVIDALTATYDAAADGKVLETATTIPNAAICKLICERGDVLQVHCILMCFDRVGGELVDLTQERHDEMEDIYHHADRIVTPSNEVEQTPAQLMQINKNVDRTDVCFQYDYLQDWLASAFLVGVSKGGKAQRKTRISEMKERYEDLGEEL